MPRYDATPHAFTMPGATLVAALAWSAARLVIVTGLATTSPLPVPAVMPPRSLVLPLSSSPCPLLLPPAQPNAKTTDAIASEPTRAPTSNAMTHPPAGNVPRPTLVAARTPSPRGARASSYAAAASPARSAPPGEGVDDLSPRLTADLGACDVPAFAR